MFEAISLMLWPLLACFVLVGIHAYLGLHVIARKVIFVDLALAQIAGLGAVFALFLGFSFEHDAWQIKLISVSFTLVGAIIFSLTRMHDETIPHEAIIGIIYAAALSMMLILSANLPHGSDEVSQMLSGSILWVRASEVVYTGCLYSVVGFIHWLFRKQFFALSSEFALNTQLSLHARLWDFLFYASFGVVVTSSVAIGGVLLVFGFLIIPSVIAVMISGNVRVRLLIAWACGLIASIIGVVLSYHFDLPSGPTIVVVLAGFLLIITLSRRLKTLL